MSALLGEPGSENPGKAKRGKIDRCKHRSAFASALVKHFKANVQSSESAMPPQDKVAEAMAAYRRNHRLLQYDPAALEISFSAGSNDMAANTSICNIRLLDTPFSAEIAEANSVRTDKLAAQTIYTSTASCLVHRAALIVCLPGSQPSENLAQVACATRPRKHTIWIFYAST
eukprot:CAMPEP_0115516128 /NCGR_PEP_ID=MMETSP0271-20121206/76597_1 /TAXON_ID=71861 /ORGANISM="Scrippsiella trochoidea, Strain CCMP3099" /LENGTH=171 /DNA_ID=CAMNT_0002946771 /DNA_START=470 /DNA_END=983 /DNA_ORIENTATION=-